MTKKIYDDYINNSLCGFLDSLADKEMLEKWQKIYISIIFKEEKENKYTKEFIDYNLLLPTNMGYLPILVDEEKKQFSIPDFDIGLGLAEYDEMEKALFKKLDSYIIKTDKKKKKK